MALTAQEQLRLDQLIKRRAELAGTARAETQIQELAEPSVVAPGLSPQDQARLRQLQQRRAELLQQQIQQQQLPPQLVEQAAARFQPVQPTGGGLIPQVRGRPLIGREIGRQLPAERAREILKAQGATDEQINNAIRISQLERMRGVRPSDLPRIAGATIGSISVPAFAALSLGITNPVALASLGLVGAFVGGAGGRGFQIGAEEFRKGSVEQLRTFGEIAREEGSAGFLSAVEETFGLGIDIGARKLIGLGKGLVRQTRETAVDSIRKFFGKAPRKAPVRLGFDIDVDELEALLRRGASRQQINAFLTGAQRSGSKFASSLESIASESLLGSRALERLRTSTQPRALEGAIAEIADDFARGLGARQTKVQLANTLKQTLLDAEAAPLAIASTLFKRVDRQIGRNTINYDSPRRLVRAIREKSRRAGGAGINPQVNAMLKIIEDTPPGNVSFRVNQFQRSQFLKSKRLYGSAFAKDPTAEAMAAKLQSSLRRSMLEAANRQSPALRRELLRANRLTRVTRERFDSPFLSGLMEQLMPINQGGRPDLVIKTAFPKGRPEEAKLLRRIILKRPDGQRVLRELQREGFQDLIETSRDVTTNQLLGKGFLSRLNRDKSLAALMTPKQIGELRNLGELARRIQLPAKGAGIVGSIVQAGILLRIPGSLLGEERRRGELQTDITLLLTPAILGGIIANPRGLGILRRALTSASVRATRQLTGLVNTVSAQNELREIEKRTGRQLQPPQLR